MRRALAMAFLTVLLASCGSGREPSRSGSGEPADFSFTTFEGEEFSADQHRGVPVVLNFWESW